MSKVVMQTEDESRKIALKRLRDECKGADLTDDVKFRLLMNACQHVLEMDDREIGAKLMVSRPTVNRWINGKNLPHRVMRKPIFDSIASMASQRLRIAERSAESVQAIDGGRNGEERAA